MTFGFNFEKYDYWPIYETINQYYPIGLPCGSDAIQWNIYTQFKGQKAFGKLIEQNFVDQKVFKGKWETFGRSLGEKLKLAYTGTTYGEVPAYSFYLELFHQQLAEYNIFKRLHVAISILGPFFTIWGEDGSVLKIGGRYYPAKNAITVSPIEEFAEFFNAALIEVQSGFPDYKFIPHSIHNQSIQGLELRGNAHSKGNNGLIYQALFNFFQTGNEVTRGDIYFLDHLWPK